MAIACGFDLVLLHWVFVNKWLNDFNTGKTPFFPIHRSSDPGAINVKMQVYVRDEKSSFKMLGLSSIFELEWDSYTVSIAKTTLRKFEPWFYKISFELLLYLYQSSIRPCMEYCIHVLDCTLKPSWYMLDTLKNE